MINMSETLSKKEALFGKTTPCCNKVGKIIVQVNKEGGGWYTSVSCINCDKNLYNDFPEVI